MTNKVKIALALGWMICIPGFLKADQMQNSPSGQPPAVDCTMMAPDVAQFAAQLSPANQQIFCGQFSDAQRATAVQLASQQNGAENAPMSPDQAVQKVATDNNLVPSPTQKTPTGCPVK